MESQPLEGLTFGYIDYSDLIVTDPLIKDLQREIYSNDEKLCAYARSLGATIVEGNTTFAPDYHLNASGARAKRMQRYQLLHSNSEFPTLQETAFSDLDGTSLDELKQDIDRGNPRLFAYHNRDRGHGKYLIETSEQVAAIEKLGEAFATETGENLYRGLVVRPFIETPSDYYTSYRVLTTATGKVQAAGLLYSQHPKQEVKRMVHTCDDLGDPYLAYMTSHFEDPDSPYFLNAKDVRSNILCGGSMIALMGNNRQPLKDGEAAILEAHAINPDNAELPPDILKVSQAAGRILGPQFDLVLGIDFIQDKQAQRFLLEVNAGPTAKAYSICHLGGKASMTDAMAIARREALEQVVAKHTVA